MRVTSKPRFRFQYGNSADKAKAFFIYPGRCYETGGKNGLILIANTQQGDTIKLEVAAKGSTAGNFLDPNDAYPVNVMALTEDLTLPAKGSLGADSNDYTWRTLEYLSQGGDVSFKEVGGGYRIRFAEVIHVESLVAQALLLRKVIKIHLSKRFSAMANSSSSVTAKPTPSKA